MARKVVDEKRTRVQEIMERILSEPVPEEGHLKHPIQPKKRSGQTTLEDLTAQPSESAFPEDVQTWTGRTMVDYYASRYNEVTGGNYRKIYRADQITFSEIAKWMISNGLEPKEWTKAMIDWTMDHFDGIRERYTYVTPSAMQRMLNHFYQDVVLPRVEQGQVERETIDVSLLEEIKEADAAGKATEIFVRFGIPVTFTYLLQVRGYPDEKARDATCSRFDSLLKGSSEDKETLARIIQTSIIGSPYPVEFSYLDWRKKFVKYCLPFQKESWWRFDDYMGRPLPKYRALIGREEKAT